MNIRAYTPDSFWAVQREAGTAYDGEVVIGRCSTLSEALGAVAQVIGPVSFQCQCEGFRGWHDDNRAWWYADSPVVASTGVADFVPVCEISGDVFYVYLAAPNADSDTDDGSDTDDVPELIGTWTAAPELIDLESDTDDVPELIDLESDTDDAPELIDLDSDTSAVEHPEALANIRGRRLCTFPDLEEGKTIDVGVLMELTGSDRFFSRSLYREPSSGGHDTISVQALYRELACDACECHPCNCKSEKAPLERGLFGRTVAGDHYCGQ
uniref:Uncharacterized protein n=1 Tax=Marseillevirus LCMAC103 TaxID=2506604 RepID=A0A481YVX8_9VIRU|nr:MAG: hypothetical protein LCMAC103_04110 [Marseillevirus LCMAC103]